MKRRWLAVLYGVLLLASHGVRRWGVAAPEVPAGLATTAVAEVSASPAARATGRKIRLAYREWRPETRAEGAPVLLLLHGSPGSSSDFRRLGPALAGRFRVVAPDLPGFGRSEKRVPDYSIRAHAGYAAALLDRLGVPAADVLGFSMGGGVALEMARREPGRVRSLILLSAIGAQEFELLGGHRLNHAVHGVQLGLLWLLHEAVPHFGLLDRFPLDVPYARNFFDTDQRPLRRVLETFAGPALIVHGERDPLVPVAAAREHHRVVPQSELVLIDSDHFMTFRAEAPLVSAIAGFLERVEAGAAPTRAEAAPRRLAEAARPLDPRDLPRVAGISLVVMMGLLALATLVSEDLACIAAGLLVAQGRLGFLAACLACFAGILVGDLLLFLAGRHLGRGWLGRRPLRWLISPRRVARSSEWFACRGPAVILLSRFLPGARLPTYFAAGLLHLRLRSFVGWFALAVALWTPLLVGVSRWLGAGVYGYFELFRRWALPGFLGLTGAVWLVLFLLPRLATFSGRRRLVGWWLRLTRWEFWPPWLFYAPVVGWVLLLALRHRSPTLFTAANPALPAGGFVGESKAGILDRLPGDSVAPYHLVDGSAPPGRKLEAVRWFVGSQGIDLPVVLKPDVGQRGVGVVVARGWDEVERYVRAAERDFLVQKYVPGLEYGVFYVRLPGAEEGRIFSITEKVLPAVTGDGRSTLRELILADARAVAVADLYLEHAGDRADRVPAAGESVSLTDLGTHCRGALFLDGRRLLSPALERELDRISRGFEGFWFGRYDLRTSSEDSLRAARDLVILELNGVTSEATHIYDPGISLWRAYRTLFEQWRLAFEVGRRNRERGAEVEPARRLLLSLWRHYRQPGGGLPAAGAAVARPERG